jgi:hypothetical protein
VGHHTGSTWLDNNKSDHGDQRKYYEKLVGLFATNMSLLQRPYIIIWWCRWWQSRKQFISTFERPHMSRQIRRNDTLTYSCFYSWADRGRSITHISSHVMHGESNTSTRCDDDDANIINWLIRYDVATGRPFVRICHCSASRPTLSKPRWCDEHTKQLQCSQ